MTFRKVSVPTVPTLVASYNPKRVCITVFNNGTAKIYIHHAAVNITEKGFPLGPSASVSFLKADGDDPREAIWGQSETGIQDIRVQESWEVKGE